MKKLLIIITLIILSTSSLKAHEINKTAFIVGGLLVSPISAGVPYIVGGRGSRQGKFLKADLSLGAFDLEEGFEPLLALEFSALGTLGKKGLLKRFSLGSSAGIELGEKGHAAIEYFSFGFSPLLDQVGRPMITLGMSARGMANNVDEKLYFRLLYPIFIRADLRLNKSPGSSGLAISYKTNLMQKVFEEEVVFHELSSSLILSNDRKDLRYGGGFSLSSIGNSGQLFSVFASMYF